MNDKFLRAKTIIFNNTGRFLKIYLKYLLVFFVLFLIGFITGILTCSKYISDITCANLINKYLYNFLLNECNFFSYFLSVGLFYLIICLIVILLTRNIFFMIIDCLILMFMAYIFGFDLCIIFCTLGLSGIICGFLFLGLLGLLVFIIFMIILAVAFKRCREKKYICHTFEKKEYIKLYFILIFLSLVVLLVSCILFSIIHIFVIVE